jgi:hypothetical protein
LTNSSKKALRPKASYISKAELSHSAGHRLLNISPTRYHNSHCQIACISDPTIQIRCFQICRSTMIHQNHDSNKSQMSKGRVLCQKKKSLRPVSARIVRIEGEQTNDNGEQTNDNGDSGGLYHSARQLFQLFSLRLRRSIRRLVKSRGECTISHARVHTICSKPYCDILFLLGMSS